MSRQDSHPKNILAQRLRQIRIASEISQKHLGIAAGIDPSVASARVNRYEQGVHAPDYLTAKNLAAALDIPLAYLYCEDDSLAAMIISYYAATASARKKAMAALISNT